MPRIVIDNTAPQFVFDDSSRLSDGMAKLFSDVVRTPVDVANLRQQQEREAAARGFQQQQWQHTLDQDQANADYRKQQSDRQWNNDLLASAWHEAEFDRQKANDATRQQQNDREQKRLEGDSARRWAGDLGQGAVNIGKLFGLGGGNTGQSRNAGTGWHQSADGRFFRTSADGVLEVWDPETKKIERMTGPPEGGAAGSTVQLQQPPQPLNEGFSLSPRRSGYAGVHSLGDVLGNAFNLWGDEEPVGGQPPPAANAYPAVRDMAPRSGDPSLAPRAAAPKVVDQATLQAYAQKHRMDLAAAATYLSQQGYTVQAPTR